MWEPNPEQRWVKEVCLRDAIEVSGGALPDDIVEIAKKFEAFFYTDPEKSAKKEV